MDKKSISSEIVFEKNWKDIVAKIQFKIFIIDKNFFEIEKSNILPIITNTPYYFFDAKESNKNIEVLIEILNFFQDKEINRAYHIVCIGGGITTDIGSFATSIYMRGCRLVLVPTTLLGMIDAAIGGKTAINFNGIKNNVGSFYYAEQVIVNSDFLKSLPKLELLNGWAECVKIALIDGGKLLKKLTNEKQKIDDSIILEAIRIKSGLCKHDPFDNDKRQMLNLGHSVGHIIEVISNFSISHGMSIAIGMRVIAMISLVEDSISKSRYNEILDFLSLYDLNVNQQFKVNHSTITNILKQDKKNRKQMSIVLFNEKSVYIKKMTLEVAATLIEKHIND